jgi:putative membrane protein
MLRKTLFTAALLVSSAAGAAPASKFLHDAIQGDNSEIRLGQLIASRGASGDVRSFGSTLQSDHGTARAQAAALARRMHVSVPTAIMPEARSEYARLQRLHGRAFDREVRQYMVRDHRKDIAKFEAQARSGDRQTANLARAQLPVLRKHLRIAESLRT